MVIESISYFQTDSGFDLKLQIMTPSARIIIINYLICWQYQITC